MMLQEIKIPDLGDFKDVPVLEILINAGDTIEPEQSLLILESDKATMEIPSSNVGVVQEIKIKVGDKANEGDVIAIIETAEIEKSVSKPVEKSVKEPVQQVVDTSSPSVPASVTSSDIRKPHNLPSFPDKPTKIEAPIHAGPAVRHLARELGVDLLKVKGSGRKERILKDDVRSFVKQVMTEGTVPAMSFSGSGIPQVPEIDFSQFGETTTKPLSRIKKISGNHLHTGWLNLPHVTQFDEVDITELEAFRKDLSKQRDIKMTLLTFMLKACASALQEFPHFNASLDSSKENLILKQYCNIGVAVETTNGLMVPVIKDVDKKGLFELAGDLKDLSQKARDGKLSADEMKGGCFTITSLGGIGGTAFTPIINAPEVAILGVSRAKMQPIHIDGEFMPCLMLPLSLSYDHRVIDGADGARFTQYLRFILEDVRRLLL
ncbi:dihydrolipoyllysine-residue acetyltransferase [Candidatus Halobeggiatoa sp. HSG11]|nr:dihydrolipoyllysine-residue acetyltransferase [Candidatus Halobeggiatoa sp. HSG11]